MLQADLGRGARNRTQTRVQILVYHAKYLHAYVLEFSSQLQGKHLLDLKATSSQ